MTKTITREQAVELGKIISAVHDVDFANGEGKVLVFDNAVLIMNQDDGDPEQVEAQLVVNKYERIEAIVESGIDLESLFEHFLS